MLSSHSSYMMAEFCVWVFFLRERIVSVKYGM
jgi:hypothetical protein